jgi:hypothetical protein
MAHLAVGSGWETTFVLINTADSAAQANLTFFDPDGNPLPLSLTFPQGGNPTTATTLSQTIAAGASLWVQSTGQLSAEYQEGSAQLTTNGNVSGFVIFRYNTNGQEAVVPLENRNASTYFIAYDNSGGTATGVAISSVSSVGITVPVTPRDDTGAILGIGSIVLAANGHTSFVLATQFPQTAGLRGTLEFDAPDGAQISLLGIRTPPALTFTTIPAIAGVGTQPSLDGSWIFTVRSTYGYQIVGSGQLTQTGNSVSGLLNFSGSPCAASAALSGTISGTAMSMTLNENGQIVKLTGALSADGSSATGTYSAPPGGCTNGDVGTWYGIRN